MTASTRPLQRYFACRIVRKEAEEVKRPKAKKVLIGECGHASRSAKAFILTFCGVRPAGRQHHGILA
jgi:hypothetical protein